MSGLISAEFIYKSSLIMAAQYMNGTIIEQQAVIHFVWSRVKCLKFIGEY
jgi:hypothetical protein